MKIIQNKAKNTNKNLLSKNAKEMSMWEPEIFPIF